MSVSQLLHWADYFLPEVQTLDPDLKRRGRLLVVACLILAGASGTFGAYMNWLGHYPAMSVVVLFGGLAFGALDLMVLRIVRSIPVVGFLICIQAVGIIGYESMADQGLSDPTLLWNLAIPWMAAFLIGPIWGLIFAGIVILETTVLYILATTGYPFPGVSRQEDGWFFYLASASAVAATIGYLGWLYEGQTLRTLRIANAELARTHNALQTSKDRVQNILESITDGFMALDPEYRFTFLNGRAESILGRKKAEIMASPAIDTLVEFFGLDLESRLHQCMAEGKATDWENHSASHNKWFDIHAYPFDEGVSLYFADITRRKEYEDHLIEARYKAEELARLKSNFLANVSHEIRTPLAGILGLAEILSKETTDVHKEFAELIEQNGRRLLETLNAVLDLSKLESGRVQANPERVDVVDEVRKVLSLLSPLADEKSLYLSVQQELEDVSAVVDPVSLRQILTNLIGNAIKFSNVGGVTVLVDGDEETLTLSISDTGIGISDAFLPYIFEEFRQESSGLNRSHQGTGLGLAITQRLIQLLDGSIEVESRKGQGTTFVVHLPRKVESEVLNS